jgi:hypothetical protein
LKPARFRPVDRPPAPENKSRRFIAVMSSNFCF